MGTGAPGGRRAEDLASAGPVVTIRLETDSWQQRSFLLTDSIAPAADVRFHFVASDAGAGDFLPTTPRLEAGGKALSRKLVLLR